MPIKPLADRVLVLPAPAEEKVGGIIIPDTAKENPQRGKVIAVGEGTKDEKMILKADDVVLYGKYAGTEIENEGTKYLMMRQSDVLAIFTEYRRGKGRNVLYYCFYHIKTEETIKAF